MVSDVRLTGLEPTWKIIMVVFECLAATAERMEAWLEATKVCLEKMKTEIDAIWVKLTPCWKELEAYLGNSEVSKGKLEAKKEAYPETTGANQEELETNPEEIDAAAEYYKWAPHIKATHVLYHLTRPGFQCSTWRPQRNDIQGDYRGIGGLSWGPASGHRILQPVKRKKQKKKKNTSNLCKSLQEVATAIEDLTQCAFPALPKNNGGWEAGMTIVEGIRDWGIIRQVLLGDEKTLHDALRQTLELEIIKLVLRSSIRLWKTSDRTLWRSQSPSQWRDY
jgi:hypothetical protein